MSHTIGCLWIFNLSKKSKSKSEDRRHTWKACLLLEFSNRIPEARGTETLSNCWETSGKHQERGQWKTRPSPLLMVAAQESDGIEPLEGTATKTRLSPGDRQHVYLFSLRVSQQPFLHLVVNFLRLESGSWKLEAGSWNPPRVHVSFIITNVKYVNSDAVAAQVLFQS